MHAVASVQNGDSCDYDDNGNVTRRGTLYLKYNPENRMVKASSDSGGSVYVARFACDGDGKRAKRVDNYGTVHYVGAHYERNVGTGADTTEVITRYYFAQMGKMRRLIAIRRGGTLYYIVPDHLGGTLRVVDTSGNLVDDIRYHVFGGTRSGGTNLQTDKRFTGQTLDMSTGLYWYGSRAYDPVLGRFVQPDPIVPDHKNPQALNRFSYCLNNPVRYTDPTGNMWETDDGEPGDGSQPPDGPPEEPPEPGTGATGTEEGPQMWPAGAPEGPEIWPAQDPAVPPFVDALGYVAGREGRPAGARDTRVFAEYYPVWNEHLGLVSDYGGEIMLPLAPELIGAGKTSFYSGSRAGEEYLHAGGGLGVPVPGVYAMVGFQESPGGLTINVAAGPAMSITVDPSSGRPTGFLVGLASPGASIQYHLARKIN